MKQKITKYKLDGTANKLIDIVSSEIKKNVFKKRFNLSGKNSNDGGLEIYNSVSLIIFKPNLGPLVKLKLTCVNSNYEGTESNLQLERVNGSTLLSSILVFYTICFCNIRNGCLSSNYKWS